MTFTSLRGLRQVRYNLSVLTRVALGQARFVLPGLVPDNRGVVAGRDLVARFATLERLVAFLGALGSQPVPPDLWTDIKIAYMRPPGGMREVVVTLPHPGGEGMDLVSGVVRLAGGRLYTGTGTHLVRTRDRTAPLGYDAVQLNHQVGDLVFYDEDSDEPLATEAQLPFSSLVMQLDLRRSPRALPTDIKPAPLLYVTARRGVGPALALRLLRGGARVEVAACENTTSFTWLFRVEEMPARLWPMVLHSPGIGAFAPAAPGMAVAVGYHHPLPLELAAAALGGSRLLLFAPMPQGVTVIETLPVFVPAADWVALHPPVRKASAQAITAGPPPAAALALRLEAAPGSHAPVVATFFPWSMAPFFQRLCYALPALALLRYQVAFLEAGVLVVTPDLLRGFPFGQMLQAGGPGILIPVGTRFRPDLPPQLLRERFGLGTGEWLIHPGADLSPFRLAPEALEPLERALVGRLALPEVNLVPARRRDPEPAMVPPQIELGNLGWLPLWGRPR